MIGLYEKFTVTRNEGTPPFKGEHFVLYPNRDPWAYRAMLAYAEVCKNDNPQLSNDITAWLGSEESVTERCGAEEAFSTFKSNERGL